MELYYDQGQQEYALSVLRGMGDLDVFIQEVKEFIRTQEERNEKAKEIENILTLIRSEELKCFGQVCKMSLIKWSFIDDVFNINSIEINANMLTKYKEKGDVTLDELLGILSNYEIQIPERFIRILSKRGDCNLLICYIQKYLEDLQKELDKIETELRETHQILEKIRAFLSFVDSNIQLVSPEIALKLYMAKNYFCTAQILGQLFISNVTSSWKRKQIYCNMQVAIKDKIMKL